jgi:protein-S-isoprenylcysteine O-methyltransferase Ste14
MPPVAAPCSGLPSLSDKRASLLAVRPRCMIGDLRACRRARASPPLPRSIAVLQYHGYEALGDALAAELIHALGRLEAMESTSGQRRGLVVAVALGGTALFLGLAALGWGGASALLADPARAAFVVVTFAFTLLGLVPPVNLSSGLREDVADRWIFAPSVAGLLLLFWVVPYLDRHDFATFGGDGVRWAGVAIFGLGCALRIWPMFVLGRRFSGLVAIQPGHELVTDGPYRFVRHPSYLGMMLALAGWALVFRSGVGLAATAVGLVVLGRRIEDEEALLASQFGSAWTDYCRRTWRLLPGVY